MGQLSVSQKLSSIIMQFLSTVSNTFAPIQLKDYAEGDKEQIYQNLNFAMKTTGIFCVVFISVFFCVGIDFLKLWIPNEDTGTINSLTRIVLTGNIIVGICYPLYYVNTMTKKLKILDETCENTNVVNEMNIPILCMGCKDMVIAVSGDGILISDKERSGYMKPYVEKIETEAMYAEKSWGSYTVIDVQPGSMTVKISMKAGEHMTYHMHNYREEVWTVVSGKGRAIVDGMEQVLRTGDVITIAAGCKHTVEAITALDI